MSCTPNQQPTIMLTDNIDNISVLSNASTGRDYASQARSTKKHYTKSKSLQRRPCLKLLFEEKIDVDRSSVTNFAQ